MQKLPHQKQPCKNCPFRKDSLKGWLGKERMTEILTEDSFVCHKNHNLQCAGFMLIQGNNSAFVRLAKAYKMNLELRGQELIFDSKKACISHHTNNRIMLRLKLLMKAKIRAIKNKITFEFFYIRKLNDIQVDESEILNKLYYISQAENRAKRQKLQVVKLKNAFRNSFNKAPELCR